MAESLGASIQANIAKLTEMLATAMNHNGRMLDIFEASKGRQKGKVQTEGPAMKKARTSGK